jgi:hypothetical protein
MKELVKRILTNHPQSSLEGLHMITGGSIEELKETIADLLEEGWLSEGSVRHGDAVVTVFKKKKEKQLNLGI